VTSHELYDFYIDAGSQMAKVAILVSDPNRGRSKKIRSFMTARLFGKNKPKRIKIGSIKK